jgi:hypothetical protein
LLPDANLLLFTAFSGHVGDLPRRQKRRGQSAKNGEGVVEILVRTGSRAQGRSRFGGRDLQTHRFYATGAVYWTRAQGPHQETERTS